MKNICQTVATSTLGKKAMTPYRDWDHSSGVRGFEEGAAQIDVWFKDGSVYRYTVASAGARHIAEMIRLARQGDGLNSYINRNLREKYAARLR